MPTRRSGRPISHTNGYRISQLALLDWDTQVLSITDDGEVIGTLGQMEELFDTNVLQDTRLCGEQTKET